MDFEYKDGKCIVTKQEMKNCLVLPKGSFSLSRDTLLSKEGFEKLKDVVSKDNVKSGKCCINKTTHDDCYVIPMGVLHPKLSMLISHAAISGIGSAIAKAPNGKSVAPKKVKQPAPAPPLVPPAPEVKESDLEEAQLTVEIAEENLEEAKKALAGAQGGDVTKAQQNLETAEQAVNEAKQAAEEMARRVKPDGS